MKKNIRFIYFYTLILSEYQKNKINILRENNFFEFKSYYILKNKKIKNKTSRKNNQINYIDNNF